MKTPRPPGFHKQRRTENWTEYGHDAYVAKGKLKEPARCRECGAIFHDGRWQWKAAVTTETHDTSCPACRRIKDDYPAGYVHLTGKFLAEHRAEILALARHQEAKEKAEHPLQRIMKITDQHDGVDITTTDTHMARAIGEALHHAYQGTLDLNYGPEDNVLRVSWFR
jgi:NMD protein affecting ribosome stability and mRNA decay